MYVSREETFDTHDAIDEIKTGCQGCGSESDIKRDDICVIKVDFDGRAALARLFGCILIPSKDEDNRNMGTLKGKATSSYMLENFEQMLVGLRYKRYNHRYAQKHTEYNT